MKVTEFDHQGIDKSYDDKTFALKNSQKLKTLGSYLIQKFDSAAKEIQYLAEYNTIAPDASMLYINRMNEAIISKVSNHEVASILFRCE